MVFSTETGKQLQFYNPIASMNATPEFTPDGKRILFSSTFSVKDAQIFSADLHGGDLRRISNVRAIEVSPANQSENRARMFCSFPADPATSNSGE